MIQRSDIHVIAAIAVGGVLGLLLGLLVGDARTFGALGAMVGLVVGCSLSVLPPVGDKNAPEPRSPA